MANAGWFPQPDGSQRYWDGNEWTGGPSGDTGESEPGWHKLPDGTDGYWDGTEWAEYPEGWVIQEDGSQRYWDGKKWTSGYVPAPGSDKPPVKRPPTPEERDQANKEREETAKKVGNGISSAGCLILIAIAAFLIVGGFIFAQFGGEKASLPGYELYENLTPAQCSDTSDPYRFKITSKGCEINWNELRSDPTSNLDPVVP